MMTRADLERIQKAIGDPEALKLYVEAGEAGLDLTELVNDIGLADEKA
jgi:hypothetical protein